MIDSLFCALIPLDECVSKWTPPSTKSNFSSLKIENVDYNKMIIIKGDVEIKTKHLSIIFILSNGISITHIYSPLSTSPVI